MKRFVVAVAAWVLMLSGVLASVVLPASPASAAASAVSLGVSPSLAAPAENIVLSGVVAPAAAGWTVALQRYGTSWATVVSVKATDMGAYSATVRAGAAGSRTSWRAWASPLRAAASVVSATRVASVVAQSVSLAVPVSVETGLGFAVSGTGYPVRAERPMALYRLSGRSWVEVGRTRQASTGRYAVATGVSAAGAYTYRVVALAWRGAAAVGSVNRVASAHVPYILLTPSTAMAAETVRTTGRLPGIASRAVWVQRLSGRTWVTVVKAVTSRTGSYVATFRAPGFGSYAVRSLAPAVRLSGILRAQYVTAAKTLKVVAQTGALTIPATLAEARTGTASMTFAPARTARAVTLQKLTAGIWTNVATGTQSSAGKATFVLTAGTPGTYSYRAYTAATTAGAAAFASPTQTLKVTRAPVTGVHATPANTSVVLTWTNPVSASRSGVMIRRAVGPTAPASPTAGTLVTDLAKPAASYTDTGLNHGTQYSYALFAHGATPD
ncbi:MAG TPA: hypothetical protein VIJ15_12270, partial [Dermatophilaceae bacterium]